MFYRYGNSTRIFIHFKIGGSSTIFDASFSFQIAYW
jgi:hypothetical protein